MHYLLLLLEETQAQILHEEAVGFGVVQEMRGQGFLIIRHRVSLLEAGRVHVPSAAMPLGDFGDVNPLRS